MEVLLGIGSMLINVLILIGISRRVLGVPIGWGRAAIISALTVLGAEQATVAVLDLLGIGAATPAVPLLMVIVLLLGCALALQLVVLTVLELVIPTRSVPSLTELVLGIPSAWRRARRQMAIWWIVMRRGLTSHVGPDKARAADTSRIARSLRLALTDAGVTFVKFGQMLSTRADVVPAPFVRELSKLHSQVAAEPWEKVRGVVEEELPEPLDEVFAALDETPMAAASVAQVHAATLTGGDQVVLKVQRPRARQQVTADLDILDRIAHRLERATQWGRRMGAVELSDGFAQSLHEELDYRVEVANMQAVAKSGVRVPTVYPQLSGERLIVMERIDGRPLSSADLSSLTAERRRELADELFAGVIRQAFVVGTFHADLHPGNVLLTDDGELALLDFGSVGRLDRPARTTMLLLLRAVDRQDGIAATDALLSLLDRPAHLDDRALEREIGALLTRYLAVGGADTGALFSSMLDVVVRFGFRVPPALAALFRTMGALDGTLALLDPTYDLVAALRAQTDVLVEGLVGREAVQEQLEHQLATVLPLLARLPRRLARITEQLEDGTFALTTRPVANIEDRRYINGLSGQLSLTVLGSVLGAGGLFLLTRDGGPELLAPLGLWPFLGVTLLFIALTLGARVLAGVFFHDERGPDSR